MDRVPKSAEAFNVDLLVLWVRHGLLCCQLVCLGIGMAVNDNLEEQIPLEQGLHVGIASDTGLNRDGASQWHEPAMHGNGVCWQLGR